MVTVTAALPSCEFRRNRAGAKQAVTVNILDRSKVAHNEHRQTAATVIKDDKTDRPRDQGKNPVNGQRNPTGYGAAMSSAEGGEGQGSGRGVVHHAQLPWGTLAHYTTGRVGGRENSQTVLVLKEGWWHNHLTTSCQEALG